MTRSLLPVLKRPGVIVLQALLLTALLAGTAAWSMTGKTVSLSVDGEPRDVTFRGSTVEDVLSAAGLEADPRDLVVPSLTSTVDDGDSVALRRARELQLVVDGEERTVWVTAASVAEALDQVGLRTEGAALSASRSRQIPLDGLALDVRLPKAVAILADGERLERTTTAASVRDALIEADVHLRPGDLLSADRTDPVTAGLEITVTRIDVAQVTETVAVPFETERRNDATMTEGTTKTLTAGKNGAVERTYAVTRTNGVETGRELVSSVRKAEPVTRVLAVGTKPKPAPAPRQQASSTPRASTGGADSLNWPALARCESGGNPRAVSPSGKYHGLYQFSQATWNSVGGSGSPSQASPDEQTYRAKVLYNRSGAGQWPTCGRHLFT